MKRYFLSTLKELGIISLLLLPPAANAENTNYINITEIKSWQHPKETDIYLTNQHACAGRDKNRFLLGKDRKQAYALLLTALTANMKVNLHYNCNGNGYPVINGVRVRK